MIEVADTFINGIELSRDENGGVMMACRVTCTDAQGNVVHSELMNFSESKNHDCRHARIFAKRLHRMVKERLLRELEHFDMKSIKAELQVRGGCCKK